MRILITGGCGFIGHHFVEHFLKNTDWEMVVLDKLTYASNGFDKLRDIDAFDNKRVMVLTADITNPISPGVMEEIGNVDYIFHLAAETHVDSSIQDPAPFVMANVIGTMNMLDLARKIDSLKCFFYFSTDEAFGPALGNTCFSEDDRRNPTNPYAAAKVGGEVLAQAYRHTYGLPLTITRTMNVFGERQHPEKFIPKIVNYVMAGKTLTIHANKDKTKAGSRFYIHARNVADIYLFLVKHGVVGEDYHITGEKEVDNLEMAQFIAKVLNKPLKYEMVDFHSSRPGHDLRYCLKDDKLRKLGWKMPVGFEESLTKTVQWMIKKENKRWLRS